MSNPLPRLCRHAAFDGRHVRCGAGVKTGRVSVGVCVHSRRAACVAGKAGCTAPGEAASGGEPAPVQMSARPTGEKIEALARDQWPAVARLLAGLATADDAGLGDTLYRAIGERNSERFSRTFKALMGYECGCASRRARMNERYPLR